MEILVAFDTFECNLPEDVKHNRGQRNAVGSIGL